MNLTKYLSTGAPWALGLMRVVFGFLFLAHGSQKLFGFPGGPGPGSPPLLSLLGTAGVLEFFGGVLVVIGLFTRPVGFILAGEMAVAYFMVHAPRGPWPLKNGGELAVLYCFAFLYLAFAGAGRCSADQWLRGQKSS